MVSYCCKYCFLNALLDISIHFLDRSDHKDMMEETGDSQQSGYNQCTVCCTRPRCTLSQGAACRGLGMGQTKFLGALGQHTALHCVRRWPCMLTLFLLVIQLLALSLHSIRGLQMPPPPHPKPTGFLTEEPGFFCFEATPGAS